MNVDEKLLVKRRLAYSSLHYFTKFMFQDRKGFRWEDNWHHKLICEALMRVYNGETKRLIINIPPRYSKTEIAVVNFIAWSLGHCPDAEFIHTSYSGGLALNNSFGAKLMVQSDEYRAIFPGVHIRSDSNAKGDWRTSEGGVVYATGSLGTITGFGAGKMRPGFAGAIIIDDPHKASEAKSDVKRNAVIEWFGNTLESRTNHPDTPIIVIMQRLHQDDLAGFLLDNGNGEEWEHLFIPALNADGEPLWPFKHTKAALDRMAAANPYVFAGQYMQSPAPAGGGLFETDQIAVIEAEPVGAVEWIRGWDLAASTDGDYTVGAKVGVMPSGQIIISDIVRGKWPTDERDAAIRNTAALDGKSVKISIPQDPGQAGKSLAIHMVRMLAGYNIQTSTESGDKVTRAEPFASQVNVGNVSMVRGGWNRDLINEMSLFPAGSHDDQVDAVSRCYAELALENFASAGFYEKIRSENAAREAAKAPTHAEPITCPYAPGSVEYGEWHARIGRT